MQAEAIAIAGQAQRADRALKRDSCGTDSPQYGSDSEVTPGLAVSQAKRRAPSSPYRRLERLDGRHPFKSGGSDCYVDYRARRRHDAEVAYLNFGLAREMGVIPADHPDRLTPALRRALLD